MGRITVCTSAQLARAVTKVRAELKRHGFLDDKMLAVDVRLKLMEFIAFGRQHYGRSGDIEIAQLTGAKFVDWLFGQYTPLADVLRHEYGHAFADTHRGLMRRKTFRLAFGAPHHAEISWEHDGDVFVSAYAATSPMEDFAETFMFFLRHGGRLPRCLDTPWIRAKWEFVRRLSCAPCGNCGRKIGGRVNDTKGLAR